MGERPTDQQLSHTVSEELLEKATRIKEEKQALQKRLDKLDSSRKGVSDAVFKKVHADYMAKLAEIDAQSRTLRKEVDPEIAALTKKKTFIEESLKHHREKVEEVKLRHSLDEVSKQDYEEVVREGEAEMTRLGSFLKKAEEDLARFNKLMEGERVLKETLTASDKRPLPVRHTTNSSKSAVTDRTTTPHLNLVHDGKVAQTIPLDGTLRIGRSPSNELVLKEPKVSRRHAEIQVVGDKHILIDLESSNGTFVGGRKVQEHALKPGDEIRIGKTLLIFKA